MNREENPCGGSDVGVGRSLYLTFEYRDSKVFKTYCGRNYGVYRDPTYSGIHSVCALDFGSWISCFWNYKQV